MTRRGPAVLVSCGRELEGEVELEVSREPGSGGLYDWGGRLRLREGAVVPLGGATLRWEGREYAVEVNAKIATPDGLSVRVLKFRGSDPGPFNGR